jgi:type I restriction enzyme S subunit
VRLRVGDVIITKDSEAWNDIGVPALVEYAAADLLCGYHLAILRPRDPVVLGDFLLRALQSQGVACQYFVAANGVTRYGLSHDAIKSVFLPIPPLPEQSIIARFLDHADTRTQRFITAKRRLIELLNEQKQAIIQKAVTRGLNSDVHLKPSGVEWFGDVPEHWNLVPLKRTCKLIRDGTHQPPPRTLSGFPLLSVRNIITEELVRRPDDSFISEADYSALCRSFVPEAHDVLLAIVGATLGKVAIVPEMLPFQIQRSLAVLRPVPDQLDYRFLASYLRSAGFQSALWQTVAFSAQPGIYLGTIATFPIPLPHFNEQVAIGLFVADRVKAIDRAITAVRSQVGLIREYRAHLIADVVTGKLDVRGVELPEIEGTEEPSPVADEMDHDVTEEGDELKPVEESADAAS